MDLLIETKKRNCKKAIISHLCLIQAITTSQGVELSRQMNNFESDYQMLLHCITLYNITYKQFPKMYQDDTKFLILGVIRQPNLINEIEKANKEQFKEIRSILKNQGIKSLKKQAKDKQRKVIFESRDGCVTITNM